MRANVRLIEGGEIITVNIVKMTGKKYNPGKTPDGKEWLDKVGEPDDRYQVYGEKFKHKVFADRSAVKNHMIAAKDQTEPEAVKFFA